ncbi:hypothetical protein Aperf_G00000032680 [Anoplocephala perfoliata]
MAAKRFEVKRCIAKGCFSLIFEVEKEDGNDKGKRYALKRTFLQCYHSIVCAIRERRILERIAREKPDCQLLPTLYYSFIHSGSPFLVMNLLSPFYLADIIVNFPALEERVIVFYMAEMLCGLEQLHSMQIVHLDLKANNILISQSGHLVISDFDRSIDLSITHTFKEVDYCVPISHAAPEIRSRSTITTKADIWSLGIIVGEMVGRCTHLPRPTELIRDFKVKCLITAHENRPDVMELKRHSLFQSINWDDIASCKNAPPFPPSEIRSSKCLEFPFLLNCAFETSHSYIKERQKFYLSDDGTRVSSLTETSETDLTTNFITEELIREGFEHYEFTNPIVQTSKADCKHAALIGASVANA